jgi:hypothetical protein
VECGDETLISFVSESMSMLRPNALPREIMNGLVNPARSHSKNTMRKTLVFLGDLQQIDSGATMFTRNHARPRKPNCMARAYH